MLVYSYRAYVPKPPGERRVYVETENGKDKLVIQIPPSFQLINNVVDIIHHF